MDKPPDRNLLRGDPTLQLDDESSTPSSRPSRQDPARATHRRIASIGDDFTPLERTRSVTDRSTESINRLRASSSDSARHAKKHRRQASRDFLLKTLHGSPKKTTSKSHSKATHSSSFIDKYKSFTGRHTRILMDSERSLILDIGTRYTKYGLTTDSSPRTITSTKLLQKYPRICKPHAFQKFKKNKIIAPSDVYLTQCPLSKETWQTLLYQFLFDTIFIEDNFNIPVFVCEDPFWPSFIQESIQKALFKIGVPQICFVNSLTCPVFCTGGDTALVVDVGFTLTKIQGLIGGHVVTQSLHSTPVGMYSMINSFKEIIKTYTRGQLDCDKYEIDERQIEACICRVCYIKEKNSEPGKIRDVPYEFISEQGRVYARIPGKARSEVAEILFDSKNSKSVTVAVAQSLRKCPLDVRRRLISSILPSGGVPQLPGFQKRLGQEFKSLVETNPEYANLKDLSNSVRFSKVNFQSNCLIWNGAQIFRSLRPPKSAFINRPKVENDLDEY